MSVENLNNNDNIVRLSGREHYICHLLLMKICEKHLDSKTYGKSVYSVMCFTMSHLHADRYILPSRVVDTLRVRMSKLRKGIPTGRSTKHTKITKKKMSDNHWSKRGWKHPLLGKGHRVDSIDKMRKNSTKNLFTAISPTGCIYDSVSIPHMVREYDLNRDCIVRFLGQYIPPVEQRRMKQTKQSRHNTTGWKFVPISA